MIRSTACLIVVALFAACSGEGTSAGSASDGRAGEAPLENAVQGEEYEREIVFTSTQGDSTFMIPWLFRSRTRTATGTAAASDAQAGAGTAGTGSGGGVQREARALLSRGGAWEPFFHERWEGPPTRTPWRIIPRPPLRLVVGENDALDRLIFRDGARELEVLFGETVTEWAGARGEIFRLQEGAVILGNQQLGGILLDIARARHVGDAPAGDWAFLVSDGGFRLFLDDPGGQGEGPGRYRAWTRSGSSEVQWPAVDVEWTEVRAFERARRDVPYAWSFASRDQLLRGELTVRTAHLAAGEGPGPLLPVDALYEVRGSVYISGATHDVRGLFRHVQP
jgi:hypothetical protein